MKIYIFFRVRMIHIWLTLAVKNSGWEGLAYLFTHMINIAKFYLLTKYGFWDIIIIFFSQLFIKNIV